MKIVIDENIEMGIEAFGNFGNVEKYHGRKITNEILKDTDILVVRSVTKVNESLLENTPVKFVGTTTIGTDHLDTEYLKENKIRFASAPGCNSYAVTEYVITVTAKLAAENKFDLKGKTLGIIGYGNIGTKLARYAKALGMKVIINDPPLERTTRENIFSDLEETLTADIISCHVPLNKKGIDKTVHLLNEERINSLKPGTILINSSRGPVADNTALLKRINDKNDITAILDVWENEPQLNRELLNKVYIGTPHIAGYSLEGKVNGTYMIYDELCEFLNEPKKWEPDLPVIPEDTITPDLSLPAEEFLNNILNKVYKIEDDSKSLKVLSSLPPDELGNKFDLLRKEYPFRREFNNYKIKSSGLDNEQKEKLKALRFNMV